MGMGAGAGGAGSNLWPLALAQLGGSVLGAVTAPEGQELQSFEGEGNLDPRQALTDARGAVTSMLGTLQQRASRPIELRSAYVQQPPVFSGGGLPMPIGVSGMDPALADSSLLSLPGLNLPGTGSGDDPFHVPRTHEGGGVDSNDGYQPSDDAVIDEDRFAVPRSGTLPVGGDTTPRRRNAISRAAGPSGAPNVSQHDDLAQGVGAVELLLRSMVP